LAETYKNARPFIGVILAGVFTDGALNQLRSLGFCVLYFSYDTVVAAFKDYGVDASFNEDTPDAAFRKKADAYDAMSAAKRSGLARGLLRKQKGDVEQFVEALEKVVSRQIDRITVMPLHGNARELPTVADAIKFIEGYEEKAAQLPIQCYEIRIRYNNGDAVEATFRDKDDAVAFLRTYQPVDVVRIKKKI
jgi:hypothetical protein